MGLHNRRGSETRRYTHTCASTRNRKRIRQKRAGETVTARATEKGDGERAGVWASATGADEGTDRCDGTAVHKSSA